MKFLKLNKQDSSILMPLGIFLALILIVGLFVHFDALEPKEMQQSDQLLPRADTSKISDTSIQIGTYVDNIYNLSATAKEFDVDGWVWVKWSQKAQEYFENRELTPDKWLNFVNQVNDWDFKLDQLYQKPMKLKDGRYYQAYKFSGHFYVNEINFRKFPFQTIKLPVIFELADFAGIDTKIDTHKLDNINELELLPDEASSNVGSFISIAGYKTIGFKIISEIHKYGSDFGLNKSSGFKNIDTNQIIFETSYKPSVNAALLTLFLPLLIVMTLVLFSPMLSASLWEVRLGIPPMAFLTLIFLQQIHKDKLPNLPYITYMDIIYNICYFIILILFVLFLWGSNRLEHSNNQDKATVIRHINEIDDKVQICLVVLLFISSYAAWLSI
jgi:hypothetical protein